MTLGQKLQLLRKEKGISQEKLAAELGVSRQAVSKWELDAALPETENIIKIRNIFNVSFDYLMDNSIDNTDAHTVTRQTAKHSGRNIYIDNMIEFLKKYGYFCGYILSAISAYCFTGYSVTFLSLVKVISPSGEMSVILGATGMSNAMTNIFLMYILLSFGGIVGGLWLAKFLKRKTEKYRISPETDRR